MELETEELESDLAVVHATAGFIRGSFDPKAFPIGETIGAVDAERAADTLDFEDEGVDVFVATVERGGRWYVSLSYTVAEYARRAAGVELAEPGAAVRPEGFPTAQAAAQALIDRLVALDLRGAVATAAPGEGDALARYAPLWLPGVQESVDATRTDGLSLSIRDTAWDVTETGDRAVATLTRYTLEGTLPRSYARQGRAYEAYPDEFELPPFDPSLPTVIMAYESAPGWVVIPAGQPVPERIDASTPRTSFEDLPEGPTNYGDVGLDGVVMPAWSDDSEPPVSVPPPPPVDPAVSSVPIAFTMTLDGACSTVSGPLVDELVAGSSFDSFFFLGVDGEKVGDDFRFCDDAAQQFFWFLAPLSASATSPPPMALVRVEGQWYVSPLGSVAAWAVGQLRGIATSDTGLDGPLSWWIYGTDRGQLEDQLSTRSRDDMGESCIAISAFDAESSFVRVIDAPGPSLVRACLNDLDGGDWFSYPAGDDDSGTSMTTAAAPVTTPWRTLPPVNAPATTAPAPPATATTATAPTETTG